MLSGSSAPISQYGKNSKSEIQITDKYKSEISESALSFIKNNPRRAIIGAGKVAGMIGLGYGLGNGYSSVSGNDSSMSLNKLVRPGTNTVAPVSTASSTTTVAPVNTASSTTTVAPVNTASSTTTVAPDEIANKIKNFEASGKFNKTLYMDHGHPAIGYGQNIDTNNPKIMEILGIQPGMTLDQLKEHFIKHPLNEQQANSMLLHNLSTGKKEISNLFGKDYEEMRPSVQKILADMHYNMGSNRLSTFKDAISNYKSGNFKGFVDEIKDSKYYKNDVVHNHDRFEYLNNNLDTLLHNT